MSITKQTELYIPKRIQTCKKSREQQRPYLVEDSPLQVGIEPKKIKENQFKKKQ